MVGQPEGTAKNPSATNVPRTYSLRYGAHVIEEAPAPITFSDALRRAHLVSVGAWNHEPTIDCTVPPPPRMSVLTEPWRAFVNGVMRRPNGIPQTLVDQLDMKTKINAELDHFKWKHWQSGKDLVPDYLFKRAQDEPEFVYLFNHLSTYNITSLSFQEVQTRVIYDLRRKGAASGAPSKQVEVEAKAKTGKVTVTTDRQRTSDHKMSDSLTETIDLGSRPDKPGPSGRISKGAKAKAAKGEPDEGETGMPPIADKTKSEKTRKKKTERVSSQPEVRSDVDTHEVRTDVRYEWELDHMQVVADLRRYLTPPGETTLAPMCQAFRDWSSPSVSQCATTVKR